MLPAAPPGLPPLPSAILGPGPQLSREPRSPAPARAWRSRESSATPAQAPAAAGAQREPRAGLPPQRFIPAAPPASARERPPGASPLRPLPGPSGGGGTRSEAFGQEAAGLSRPGVSVPRGDKAPGPGDPRWCLVWAVERGDGQWWERWGALRHVPCNHRYFSYGLCFRDNSPGN